MHLAVDAAEALLHSMVPEPARWAHGRRDVYISRSWHPADLADADPVCSALVKPHGFRPIGDSPDYSDFDAETRLRRIIESCGALVALFPFRDKPADGFTSKFMVAEVQLAKDLGRPFLLFAAPRVKLDRSLVASAFSGRVFALPAKPAILKSVLSDFDRQYQPSPRIAYSFFATSLLKEEQENERARLIVQQVTSMECQLGRGLKGKSAQEEIIDRIRNAEFVIADLSPNDHNSLIEAGIALGARRPLHLLSRVPEAGRRETRFMLRDMEIGWYSNALERIAYVHQFARKYRRQIIHPRLD
jgi:hypothetical protein